MGKNNCCSHESLAVAGANLLPFYFGQQQGQYFEMKKEKLLAEVVEEVVEADLTEPFCHNTLVNQWLKVNHQYVVHPLSCIDYLLSLSHQGFVKILY